MRRGLLALALALGGCSVLQNPHAGPEADAWAAIRGRYTRTAKLYDRFETHAFGTATWQVAEVRARRVDQVAAWKAMTAPDACRRSAADPGSSAISGSATPVMNTTMPSKNLPAVARPQMRHCIAVSGAAGATVPSAHCGVSSM